MRRRLSVRRSLESEPRPERRSVCLARDERMGLADRFHACNAEDVSFGFEQLEPHDGIAFRGLRGAETEAALAVGMKISGRGCDRPFQCSVAPALAAAEEVIMAIVATSTTMPRLPQCIVGLEAVGLLPGRSGGETDREGAERGAFDRGTLMATGRSHRGVRTGMPTPP